MLMTYSPGPAEQGGDIIEAERLYRLLIKSDPADASASFNLGNMLRAHARNIEAEAAFRSATRTDPTFAAAWYNLADLLDDQGRNRFGHRMPTQSTSSGV